MQDADLDGVLRLGGQGRRHAERQPGRGGKQAEAERSLGDRANRCVHRNVLLLTRNRRLAGRPQGQNRKRRAKPAGRGKPLRLLFDPAGRRPAEEANVSRLLRK
jgi:hypothetical protein